jgi:hypothetical protein
VFVALRPQPETKTAAATAYLIRDMRVILQPQGKNGFEKSTVSSAGT